jgi:uncharacterized protein (DUF952 family)
VTRILHAARPADWGAARATGRYDVSTLGRSLADEGFIHASTAGQLPGVLTAFYGELDEVVLLVLDVAALGAGGAPVRWDDVPGAPGPFPHVYGAIPASVVGQGLPVVVAIPLRRDAGGGWPLPDLTTYDVATGPPGPES